PPAGHREPIDSDTESPHDREQRLAVLLHLPSKVIQERAVTRVAVARRGAAGQLAADGGAGEMIVQIDGQQHVDRGPLTPTVHLTVPTPCSSSAASSARGNNERIRSAAARSWARICSATRTVSGSEARSAI